MDVWLSTMRSSDFWPAFNCQIPCHHNASAVKKNGCRKKIGLQTLTIQKYKQSSLYIVITIIIINHRESLPPPDPNKLTFPLGLPDVGWSPQWPRSTKSRTNRRRCLAWNGWFLIPFEWNCMDAAWWIMIIWSNFWSNQISKHFWGCKFLAAKLRFHHSMLLRLTSIGPYTWCSAELQTHLRKNTSARAPSQRRIYKPILQK